jgi:hypothetical protein
VCFLSFFSFLFCFSFIHSPSPFTMLILNKMNQKRGKTKGMFGRMFGSTSSGKDHHGVSCAGSRRARVISRSISKPP